MNITPGTFLISSATMDDPYFKGSTVFITEYNDKGAMGFVINKLFPRKLNELVEFRHSKDFPLYAGGPVDTEGLFFLHCRPDVIEGSVFVADNIYLGGNFEQAVRGINNKSLAEKDIKLFIGYCGWDFGELDKEAAEGSWVISYDNIDLFNR
jgi:putative transcriptional regulator